MNRLILGNGILNGTRDKLLNLLRCGARPRTESHRHPDWNVGVLALGHAVVAKPTPYKDTHEQHPRDLRMLHEEPGGIVGFLDSILVALICHGFVCSRNHLDGVAIFQKLSADGDHALSRLDSLNSNRIVLGRSQLNLAQVCNQRTGPLLRYHHPKVFGVRRKRYDGAEWDQDRRVWNITEAD